jgi:hypothetical protein
VGEDVAYKSVFGLLMNKSTQSGEFKTTLWGSASNDQIGYRAGDCFGSEVGNSGYWHQFAKIMVLLAFAVLFPKTMLVILALLVVGFVWVNTCPRPGA